MPLPITYMGLWRPYKICRVKGILEERKSLKKTFLAASGVIVRVKTKNYILFTKVSENILQEKLCIICIV